MAKQTSIQYCDSTANPVMGCNGCELLTSKIQMCYAFHFCNRFKGRPGYPKDFRKPELFPGRIKKAGGWSDLSGANRPTKPWLNGQPRTIFLGDLGDMFTESLPSNWLIPFLPVMINSPHIWLYLTKRPSRMKTFFDNLGYIPPNFQLGTTVTSRQAIMRAGILSHLENASTWLSLEPLLGPVDLSPYLPKIDWVALGGESDQITGPGRPMELDWARSVIDQCRAAGAHVFVKQLGSHWARQTGSRDNKGGYMPDWPADLRIRQLPRTAPLPEQLAFA